MTTLIVTATEPQLKLARRKADKALFRAMILIGSPGYWLPRDCEQTEGATLDFMENDPSARKLTDDVLLAGIAPNSAESWRARARFALYIADWIDGSLAAPARE